MTEMPDSYVGLHQLRTKLQSVDLFGKKRFLFDTNFLAEEW